MATQKQTHDESLFDISQHKMVCSEGDRSHLYTVKHCNGQIIATFRNASQPDRGTEVFIKKMAVDTLLQDIFQFALQAGEVYQIRILMEFSGYNRGFCFVTYFTVEAARKATLTLNGAMLNGHYLVVKISFDNNKLELRNVPRHVNADHIYQRISGIIGRGLKDILTCKVEDPKSRSMNCILKYDTHRNALEARKRVYPTIKLWGNILEIDWATPRDISKSKRLYFHNLPRDITKEELYAELKKLSKTDTMLNIFLQRGLGYILYSSPAAAFEGYTELKGRGIAGVLPEYSFSRFYNQLSDDHSSTDDATTEASSSEPTWCQEDNLFCYKTETNGTTESSNEIVPYVPFYHGDTSMYRHGTTYSGFNNSDVYVERSLNYNGLQYNPAQNPMYAPFQMHQPPTYQPVQYLPPFPTFSPMNDYAQTASLNNLAMPQIYVSSVPRPVTGIYYNNDVEVGHRSAASLVNFNDVSTDRSRSGNMILQDSRNQTFSPVTVVTVQPLGNPVVNDLKLLQMPENYYPPNL